MGWIGHMVAKDRFLPPKKGTVALRATATTEEEVKVRRS
jgi:hypothetical protein